MWFNPIIWWNIFPQRYTHLISPWWFWKTNTKCFVWIRMWHDFHLIIYVHIPTTIIFSHNNKCHLFFFGKYAISEAEATSSISIANQIQFEIVPPDGLPTYELYTFYAFGLPSDKQQQQFQKTNENCQLDIVSIKLIEYNYYCMSSFGMVKQWKSCIVTVYVFIFKFDHYFI